MLVVGAVAAQAVPRLLAQHRLGADVVRRAEARDVPRDRAADVALIAEGFELGEGGSRVWAIDYQDDQTVDGRRLRYLNIVDEFTREVLAVEVARSITADKTVEVLEQLVETHGLAPDFIRSDNGPELICPC